MPTIRTRLLVVLVVLCGFLTVAGSPSATAATIPDSLSFDGTALTVSNGRFVDANGREVVLRGYNVSGETKLDENHGLPFASVADAQKSAKALRALGGGNSVRFLLSWAYAEPVKGQVDTAYLAAATAQMRAFLDVGIRVYPDFHQDLYSRYLFNEGSWYTGDGAPEWAVELGDYPTESCGICFVWGQNITQNSAVTEAQYDFWHNNYGLQDYFLATAEKTMTYIKQNLSTEEFAGIIGFDPYNEPYAGTYDSGQASRSWEQNLLWPFYQKFRARMDAAGWQSKPTFVEPNLFWNGNVSNEEGGLLDVGTLGSRYVFNTHFYDQKAISGILMWGNASDGQYETDYRNIRDRASALGTTAIVSEFGHPLNGSTAGKAPTVLKAMYQAMDSRVKGANWWSTPADSGSVLSGSQWQWDIYNGRHNELMNGNEDKVQTDGDAWNDEDLSAVEMDDSGTVTLRQDSRLLDRIYPSATSGSTVAFTYEDRSRDGSTTLTWNPVPSSMPNVSSLVGSGQYSVLVWRSGSSSTPTELHLPASFPNGSTTVVSDLGTVYAPSAYSSSTAIGTALEPGGTGSRRLLLTDSDSGTLHYALVTNGATSPSASLLSAAKAELASWVAQKIG